MSGVADEQVFGDGDDLLFGTSGAARQSGAGIQMRGANFETFYQNDDTSTTFVSRSLVVGMGWTHIAMVLDRDGNMTSYVNGTSQGTNAISGNAAAFPNPMFVAQYCNIVLQAAASGKAETPYALAGMAAHEALLTAAQVKDSVDKLTFQTLGATTYFAYMYGDIQLMSSGWGADIASPVVTAQASTKAIYTSTVRSELSTLVADARIPIVEITAANSDLTKGGVESAINIPDVDGESSFSSTTLNSFALIPNMNRDGTAGDAEGIGILGVANYESDETNSTNFSPALGYDDSWPPAQGVAAGLYA